MSTKEDLETWTNGTFGEYEIHLTAGFYKVYFHGAWGGGSDDEYRAIAHISGI